METKYVVGFAFDYPLEHVALILKNRPAWQAGKLNGVGGHIEPGETAEDAMVREFHEETGASGGRWKHFATVRGKSSPREPDGSWSVAFFWTRGSLSVVDSATDEEVFVVRVQDVQYGIVEVLPNLKWLIPMAINDINEADRCSLFDVSEMVHR